MQGEAALETQSQKYSTKLQSQKQQTTKIATNIDSGVNNNTLSDTIMAAHGPQQVADGQSDTAQGQTAASDVITEQNVDTQAQSKTSKKKSSKKTKSKKNTVRISDSHANSNGSEDNKTAPVTASQTEVLDQAPTQTHTAAIKGTGDKTALLGIE